MRRLLRVGLLGTGLLLCGLVALGVPSASAHSVLIKGSPGPSDKPQAGLTTILLVFGPLSHSGPQQVKVLDPAKQDRVESIRLVGDNTLQVTVRPLEAGVHLLQYSITSADGHSGDGGYYLDVRGGPARASHVPPGLTGLVVTLGVVVVLLGLLLWRAGRRRREAPADGADG
jgi:methionine-rich copper-binding protein CopC